MTLDVAKLLADRRREHASLHARYINPQLPRVLKTIGFDGRYVRGTGCYLYDEDGNRYLDLLSGFGVFALGRGHPAVTSALHQAIDADLPNLVQLDCALPSALLAEALVARCHPGIERVFFTNSGAESVDTAVKFARHATNRSKIVFCDHGFHGLTTGVLGLNGGREFTEGFRPLLPDLIQVPFGDIEALASALAGKDVAAFVVEPIQGKGVNEAPEEYWHRAQELCRASGTLLVMDEVQAGLGRTGRFFCHEHWGLEPDMITVSKALSGGYVPVGATLGSARVFDRVFSSMDRAVVHSSTFSMNDLAMIAGLATLQAMEDEDVVDRARRTGEAFVKALDPLVERYEMLHCVRGKGLMIGLVFGEPTSRALRMRWRALESMRHALFSQSVTVPLYRDHRILTQVAADNMNVIKLLPPLVAGDEEVELFVGALDEVLHDAHHGSGHYLGFGATMARNTLRRRGA